MSLEGTESSPSREAGAEVPAQTTAELLRCLMEDRRSMQTRMESLMRMVELSHSRPAASSELARRNHVCDIILTKLTETDDIEANLTTFERMVEAIKSRQRNGPTS